MRLLGSNGRLVPMRCKAVNKCDYCAMLAAVEWSEMLALDAMENAPSVWMVLTTRSATPDPAAFYKARELLMRAIKRRWPDAEYLCIVEFTTGYGSRSGGVRRPHWNVLLKGVPVEALPELQAIVRERWCARVDAEPEAQFAGEVSEVGGLMRYLALHFLKESQRPPHGWRGHRVTASRGYFERERWRVRASAQRALRVKRELRRLAIAGMDAAEALVIAEAEVFAAEQVRWEPVIPTVDYETGELLRLRAMRGGEPTVLRPQRPLPYAAWSREANERARQGWEATIEASKLESAAKEARETGSKGLRREAEGFRLPSGGRYSDGGLENAAQLCMVVDVIAIGGSDPQLASDSNETGSSLSDRGERRIECAGPV